MTDDDQVPDILRPEHDKRTAELRRAERAAKQPAVPAPASRSGEDHAALADELEHLKTHLRRAECVTDDGRIAPMTMLYRNMLGKAAAVCRFLSRGSGEAVKRAIAVANEVTRDVAELPDRTSPPDDPDAMLVYPAELHSIVFAAVHREHLSLSASAALLTEDNKRLRERLSKAFDELIDLGFTGNGNCRYCENNVREKNFEHKPDCLLNLIEAVLSPTASPPEGQDWSGMTTRGISAEEWAAQADGKAPADEEED